MPETINWPRIEKCLFQEAKKIGKAQQVKALMDTLQAICGIVGEFSQSRSMLIRLGKTLLVQEVLCIVAPCCPDYSHDGQTYTFRALHGGISLLAQKHIAFLKAICTILPKAKVVLVFADQEACDEVICRAVKKTRDEFLDLVKQSIKATQDVVEPMGWKVATMTSYFPELAAYEQDAHQWIVGQKEFEYRIGLDTLARQDMYETISPGCTFDHMRQRTMRTAAQYVALGRLAALRREIICNHSTVNLASWYSQTEAAVLHNSVSVY